MGVHGDRVRQGRRAQWARDGVPSGGTRTAQELCGGTPAHGAGTGGSAPLCGAGMNPPFLFVLTKRNGPFTVQRETAWAQNRRQKAPFLLKTRGSTRDIGQLRQDSALGAGPALLNLSVVSPRLGIAKSECEIDLTCFSFRCRCRSQTPGGESRPRIFTRGLPTSFPLGVG